MDCDWCSVSVDITLSSIWLLKGASMMMSLIRIGYIVVVLVFFYSLFYRTKLGWLLFHVSTGGIVV